MTSDTLEITTTGLQDEPLQANVQVWPNPIDEEVNVRNTTEQIISARLIDINGKILSARSIYPQSQSIWPVQMAPGIYILQMISEDGRTYSSRLIKE